MSTSNEDVTIITNPQNVQIDISQTSGDVDITTVPQSITVLVGATISNSEGVFVIGETPSGVVDGSNAIFYSLSAFVPESVQVFVNGVSQTNIVDYVTSGTTQITLLVSPSVGDYIRLNYKRG
jgi:hypothetical protein